MEVDTEALPWLDRTYLEKILATNENEPVQVINFSKKLATEKCENFASLIHVVNVEYRVVSTGKVKETSLITKTKTSEEVVAEIIENLNVFERESHVYVVLLRAFEQLLQDAGISTQFGPRYIYVDDGIIVMENLKEKGYALQDVKVGLNYQQCLAVMKKLALFHASSMVLYKKDPTLFKYHTTPTITEEDENPMHIFFMNQFEVCIELCKSKSNFQKYVPCLEELNKNLIIKIANTFKRNKNSLNVLNHGDAWSNNFLFKTRADDQSVEDILLIDYQEGILCSPAIDLLCFIYTSWSTDTYVKHRGALIEQYAATLQQSLRALNYSDVIPTLNDINEELKAKKVHGIVAATCLLPLYLNEHQDLADPINFIADTEEAKQIRFKLMNNDKYFDKLCIFLNGLLDDN